MLISRLTKFHIRRDARNDRRHDLPAATARALSPSEQRIQAAVNLGIRALQKKHVRVAEPLRQKLKAAIEQLHNVEVPEWQRTVERLGRRQEQVTFGKWGHRLLMTVLTIGEAGFNVLAFAVSGEATIFSVGMALAVTAAIPTLAFAAGVAARQYEPKSRKLSWIAGSSTMAIIMLFVVNHLRVNYLRTTGASDSPWFSTTVAYFAINVGIYVAAAVITYLSKDPDAEFMRAKQRVEARRRQVAALQGLLNALTQRLLHEAKMYWEAGRQAIAYYRAHNSRGRGDQVPAYFTDDTERNHQVSFVDVTPTGLPASAQELLKKLSPAGME